MEDFQLHSGVFGEADVSPQFAPFVSVRLEVALLREAEHRCSGGLYPRFVSASTRPAPPHLHPPSSRRHGDIFIFHKTLMKRQFPRLSQRKKIQISDRHFPPIAMKNSQYRTKMSASYSASTFFDPASSSPDCAT